MVEPSRWERIKAFYTPRRRRMAAWIFFGVLVSFGFWRLETAISEERETRQRFEAAEIRAQADREQEDIDSCKVRNRATINGRARFGTLFDALGLVVTSPEGVEAVEVLRNATLPPDAAEQEDRDCNDNGTLDENDYAP